MTPPDVRERIKALRSQWATTRGAAVACATIDEVLRICDEHDAAERRDRAADCIDETAWALRETKNTM